ncbi:unnamed protein product [Enterobius vermicularis]|uniref:Uncharacterized protein n=1 Tax=Enterobius vermicularis TaxID=51028 RepID=A0A158QAG6_ENTVE|nr:unnamed protein product [Enterobius vermicularis]
MSRKNRGVRDTAKDIILGLEPSGSGPREPRGGYLYRTETAAKPSSSSLQPIIVEGADPSKVNRLENRLESLQRKQSELVNSEAEARRKLEKECDELRRKLYSNDLSRDLDELRRQVAALETKVRSLAQEVAITKAATEQLSKSQVYRNEERTRYTGDQNRTATQINDLADQLSKLKSMFDDQISRRATDSQNNASSMSYMQESIMKDLNNKTSAISDKIAKKNRELEELRTETTKMDENFQRRLSELEKKINDGEARYKDNFRREKRTLDSDFRNNLSSQKEAIEKLQAKEGRDMEACTKSVQDLKNLFETEKRSVGEHLEQLEKDFSNFKKKLKSESEKLNTVLTADIKTRRTHENGILAKMDYMETQLREYFDSLAKNMNQSSVNSKGATPDLNALRREMEGIAADKSKMSMEGLLKLEEKIRKINKDFARNNREFQKKLQKANENEFTANLKREVAKINNLEREMEDTRRKLTEKIETQIPQDLNELTAKTNHIKQQLNERIDKVEEENFRAVNDLREKQNARNEAMQNRNRSVSGNAGGKRSNSDPNRTSASGRRPNSDPSKQTASRSDPETSLAAIKPLKKDFEQYKIAVKKLAESVTTVKNVLERKIVEEKEKREKAVEELASVVNKKPAQNAQPNAKQK